MRSSAPRRLRSCRQRSPVIFAALEKVILAFWEDGTKVMWKTPGGGRDFPKAKEVEWSGGEYGVKQFARIDFCRGERKDDSYDSHWKVFFHSMPRILEEVIGEINPSAAPLWMKSLVGMFYAIATKEEFLRVKGCSLQVDPEEKRVVAEAGWLILENMGLKPRVSIALTLATGGAEFYGYLPLWRCRVKGCDYKFTSRDMLAEGRRRSTHN